MRRGSQRGREIVCCQNEAGELLKIAMETRHADKRPVAAAGQDPRLLRRLLRARDRMDNASHEAWPIERLAAASGVSKAHFARSFKTAFGVPPHRYLLTRRLERAKTLLRDTDMPIIEIAFQTGWNSLGTFGRVFRDVLGASPGELRAQAQADPHALRQAPACFVSAAQRPDLMIAVSEKRRQAPGAMNAADETEVS
jgi:transcriptional regulator GlxA family with amidase domain